MNTITIEQYRVGEIPILAMHKAGAESCPLVFFLHGFTGDKREGLPLGYELANKGFYFVAFDAFMHGERLDDHLDAVLSGTANNVYPVDSGLDAYCLMHEIILHTHNDINLLIDKLKNDPRVEINQIGLTGFSMGGFATFYCAANNTRIKVAAPVAGIPAFSIRWEDVILESSSYEKWSSAMESASQHTRERSSQMEENDPFEPLSRFYPRPLLMINGDLDTDSHKKYSVDLYRFLKPFYANHPERLQFNIHDGIGHQLTREMMAEIKDWFDKYLVNPD
jgi:pimeloyl-ACP methyl ester carboxylesterase